MKKILTIIVVLMSTLVNTNLLANPAGKKAYNALGCAACHGVNGIGAMPIYPNLAGQKVVYTVAQLKAYQSGTRKDVTMNAMAPLAVGKEQIIAEWLATLK